MFNTLINTVIAPIIVEIVLRLFDHWLDDHNNF